MCVIALVKNNLHRPTEDEVNAMWDANKYGGGVAWREGGKTLWRKGLSNEQMREYAKTLPAPFVLHFRIPSCGGDVPQLTHPFPIERGVRLDMSGETTGKVLFHNGHWGEWKEFSKDMVAKAHLKIPTGKWSDTRSMAFLAFHFGLGILEIIDEKVIALGPKDDDLDIFGTGWSDYKGYIVSNTGWTHRIHSRTWLNRSGQGGTSTPTPTPAKVENAYHTTPPASMLPGIRDNATPAVLTTPLPKQGAAAAAGPNSPFVLVSPKRWATLTNGEIEAQFLEHRRLALLSHDKNGSERLITKTKWKQAVKFWAELKARRNLSLPGDKPTPTALVKQDNPEVPFTHVTSPENGLSNFRPEITH